MPLSGLEVLKLYLNQGWVIIHRKGSHVKIGKGPLRETIPVHKELGVGLQRKLLKRLAETTEDSGESQ
jgi:predicted RNA binding protein YcfA (HicA-like mRNA interferase family)